jgi:hypothetical protein
VASGAALGLDPVLVLASGRYLNETGSTISGNTITVLKRAIPPGDSLATSGTAPVYGQSSLGGPVAAYYRTHQMAADQVTANTFYYMNALVGLVKWTNCGSTTIVATPGSPSFLLDAGLNDQLKAVPAHAGHLFYTAGEVGGNQPAGGLLWRTCNGSNSTANSVTPGSVYGFFEPQAVGFGDPYPGGASFSGTISGTSLTAGAVSGPVALDIGAVFTGAGVTAGTKITAQISGPTGGAGTYTVNNSQTVGPVTMTTQASPYATIYVVSWYSPTNTKNTSVYDIYRSIDDANNGATGTCTGQTGSTIANENTWQPLSGTGGFPAGFPTVVKDIEGDPFVYGPYYVLGSFGQFYGIQNYLLNGALHRGRPANDNDNSPAFLNQAA